MEEQEEKRSIHNHEQNQRSHAKHFGRQAHSPSIVTAYEASSRCQEMRGWGAL
jgi:hypothetical protein